MRTITLSSNSSYVLQCYMLPIKNTFLKTQSSSNIIRLESKRNEFNIVWKQYKIYFLYEQKRNAAIGNL